VDAYSVTPHNAGMEALPSHEPFRRAGDVIGYIIGGLLYALLIYSVASALVPGL
jgi:hypothetical protein